MSTTAIQRQPMDPALFLELVEAIEFNAIWSKDPSKCREGREQLHAVLDKIHPEGRFRSSGGRQGQGFDIYSIVDSQTNNEHVSRFATYSEAVKVANLLNETRRELDAPKNKAFTFSAPFAARYKLHFSHNEGDALRQKSPVIFPLVEISLQKIPTNVFTTLIVLQINDGASDQALLKFEGVDMVQEQITLLRTSLMRVAACMNIADGVAGDTELRVLEQLVVDEMLELAAKS